MQDTSQIILDLQNEPKLGWKDFEVGSANQLAIEWMIKWPNWPMNGLVIYGAPGCGKTHLGNLWMSMVGAKSINADNLSQLIEQNYKHFLIDGIAILLKDEQIAFHFINNVKEKNGSLLILDRAPPTRWNTSLKDLSSRLIALNSVSIQFPDEALLATILINQLKSRGLILENQNKMCKYVIDRIPRTFDAVLKFANKLNKISLCEKKPLSLGLIKIALEQIN